MVADRANAKEGDHTRRRVHRRDRFSRTRLRIAGNGGCTLFMSGKPRIKPALRPNRPQRWPCGKATGATRVLLGRLVTVRVGAQQSKTVAWRGSVARSRDYAPAGRYSALAAHAPFSPLDPPGLHLAMSFPRPARGVIHTYQRYDPKSFPKPDAASAGFGFIGI